MEARKITFQEAWNSTTVFFVDDELEDEIDAEVMSLLEVANDAHVAEGASIEVDSIREFLMRNDKGLDVILRDIELSEEKFLRIVSLLRKLGHVNGGFDFESTEWGLAKIKNKIRTEPEFAYLIAWLVVDGGSDPELAQYIPRYYLDTLNYREIRGSSQAARRIRYKRALIGTYGGRKGYKVEARIRQTLERIQEKYGVPFGRGRSRMVNTDIDFAIPDVEDPWVIIMSSFQETTSSGQTTKARDMLNAYLRVVEYNSRNRETRAFVNFVDGGGWLARKRDLHRLVEQCHYFLNLQHLEMLEAIVLKHVPARYIRSV